MSQNVEHHSIVTFNTLSTFVTVYSIRSVDIIMGVYINSVSSEWRRGPLPRLEQQNDKCGPNIS